MTAYFIRRFLLIPITMLGVTLLVFAITRFVPGGPIDQALAQAAQGGQDGNGSGNAKQQGALNEEQMEALEEEYGYDKPILFAYLQWIGIFPRELQISKAVFSPAGEEKIGSDSVSDPENEVLILLKNTGRLAKVVRENEKVISVVDTMTDLNYLEDGWSARIETPKDRQERWARRNKSSIENAPDNYDFRAVVYKKSFSGLLQGNLGRSTTYGDPVGSLILERIPIALYFGILTAFITYGVCIPLGIVKGIKHRTFVDNLSSVAIFIGYAIPGFAFGAILLVHLGARAGIFPLFGIVSPEFADLSFFGKIKDLAHHTFLPLLCYIISGFAFTTMMMKNNLMDNLAADYVRTAVSKGVSFKSAVFKHAFRNSFIPIASSLGHLVGIILMGSMLIEKVFDIQGFGLLQYQAVVGRDQTLIMGTLTISAFLLLLGNVLSDIIVAFVDPRVKFD